MEFEVVERTPIHGHRIIWTVIAVLFFFLYSWLPRNSPQEIFNSPDETANNYFANTFAVKNQLTVFEPLEEFANEMIHPRSVVARGNYIMPGSFHGLPVLYGIIAKAIGSGNIIFFTAIISVLAVLAWRRIMSTLFNSVTGSLSAIILGIMPAWIYYSNRGMYHNILFVALLIFFVYLLVCQPFRKRIFLSESHKKVQDMIDYLAGGAMLGLALWVRASEFFWIFLAIIPIFIIFWKEIRIRKCLSFFVGAALAFLPALIFNYFLYGNPLTFAYTLNDSVATSVAAAPINFISKIKDFVLYLFPFGIHLRTALINFTNYFINLPIGFTVLTGISLLILGYKFLKGQATRNEIIFAILFFGVAGWLAVLYGSWVIHDNPNPNAVTIGISYSRYWLPIFVLASGICGIAVSQLLEKWKFVFKRLIVTVIFALLLFFSYQVVFNSEGDGLVPIKNTLSRYLEIKEDVLRQTKNASVIIVDRADKIFFPERRVVVDLRNEETYKILPELALRGDVYYYGIKMSEDDLKFHNEEKLVASGLVLEQIASYSNEALYRFVSR